MGEAVTQPLEGFAPDATQFLTTFYGTGNRMKLDKLWPSPRPEAICQREFIQRLQHPPYPPTVLFRRTQDTRRIWYAFAHDDRTFRALRESLLAFVGPSYSDFHGQAVRLDLADEIDAAVSSFADGRVYKFQMPPTVDGPEPIWQALRLMLRAWNDTPAGNRMLVRPTGRLVRDFEVALSTQQYVEAEELLGKLRTEGRLDATNLAFLEVRLRIEQGQWSMLLENHRPLPLLDSVLAVRRPLRLTQALIQALYQAEFTSFEISGDVQGAVQHFRTRALPDFAPLFTALGEMNAPEALKAFLLFAAVGGSVPNAWLQRAQSVLHNDPYGQALLAFTSPAPAPVGAALDAAQRALLEQQYDLAFELAFHEVQGDLRRAAILLHAAGEIRSLHAAQAARTAVAALSDEQRTNLLRGRLNSMVYATLPGSAEGDNVDSWVAWVERLITGGWSTAVEEAEAGVLEWRLTRRELEGLAQAIRNDRQPAGQVVFREALPHLLAAVNASDFTQRERIEIYQSVIDTLVLDDAVSATDLPLIHELAEAILTEQPQLAKYQELLSYYLYLWMRFGSVKHLDWMLDVLDTLVSLPCPDLEARLRILTQVSLTFQNHLQRIPPRQRLLFKWLCLELQQPTLAVMSERPENSSVSSAQEPPGPDLSGKTIGVYTLTERAGQNFVRLASDLYPGARVELQVEHVGTDRLRSLARTADIFVVAASSATHAATQFISSERPRHLPTIYPLGKGVSSMLAALHHYLDRLG